MDNKYLLSSLENTLQIIDVMTDMKEIGITELSEKMHLGKSTIHRILNTLLKYDYVTQNEANGKYSLAFKFVNIANDILQRYDIITITRSSIEQMVEDINENAVLTSFANKQITTIENYSCRRRDKTVSYYTGYACPAYASSAGRAFLAHFTEKQYRDYMDDLRIEKITPFTISSEEELREQLRIGLERGYFACNQEINEGVVSFAAPIYNAEGRVEAAICIYGAASEMTGNQEILTAHLVSAAMECTEINKQRSL